MNIRFFLTIAASMVTAPSSLAAQPVEGSKLEQTGASSFWAYESGPVRPIALSSDGKRLFVVNTPDNRLEILAVDGDVLSLVHSVPVGMEPVAVALNGEREAWVVNHLSDSVSVVDIAASRPVVTRTLQVGDEPRDIVFAGRSNSRAFVTAAHRGQNAPFDPELTTPGVGRADVWVFDTESDDAAPAAIVSMLSDTPRALAVDPTGRFVYAAAFHSGNQTTTLKAEIAKGGLNKAPPLEDVVGAPAPKTGLIVRYDGEHWTDTGDALTQTAPRIWDDRVRFTLPDNDVFVIDALMPKPRVFKSYSGVGTTIFNMIVNPSNGRVYVSNSAARNHIRFAASGKRSSTLRGHFVENQITVVGDDGIRPRHLNGHIESYGEPLGSPQERANSLSIPLGMEISKNGKTLYLASYGSRKVSVIDTAELENNQLSFRTKLDMTATVRYRAHDSWRNACIVYDPAGKEPSITKKMAKDELGWFAVDVMASNSSIPLTFNFTDCADKHDSNHGLDYRVYPGRWSVENRVVNGAPRTSVSSAHIEVAGGASGLALNELAERLYVFSRFENVVSVIDTRERKVINVVPLYNSEPDFIVKGRPFLYDAMLSSSRGDSACASCHVFGDTDHLAWDLGNPDEIVKKNPNEYLPVGPDDGEFPFFHPMKGPMVTQSLRGLIGHGPMHWRGDKTSERRDSSLEELSFKEFNIAFVELHGNGHQLSEADMSMFTSFALALRFPPNPIRNLDQSLSPKQQAGAEMYGATENPGFVNCRTCHTIDPNRGLYSTSAKMNMSIPESGRAEDFKIPHLRNMYAKVGMFGSTGDPSDGLPMMGPQVRGFGFNHDGASDTIHTVVSEDIFVNEGAPEEIRRDNENLASFLFVINSDSAPIVGQQVTVSSKNVREKRVQGRLRLLMQRADLAAPNSECDLILKGDIDDKPRGGLYSRQNGLFRLDSESSPSYSLKQLMTKVKDSRAIVTFMCAPPGSGVRMGIDRDLDGRLDGDEAYTNSPTVMPEAKWTKWSGD